MWVNYVKNQDFSLQLAVQMTIIFKTYYDLIEKHKTNNNN